MKIKALNLDVGYQAINTVNLWYKIRADNELMLSDIPELIRLRWAYFRDNWEFIKENYISQLNTYIDPGLLNSHIIAFDEFIQNQRTLDAGKNPLSNQLVQDKFYAIFDTTPINSLILSYQEQTIFDARVQEITNYSRSHFIALRDTLIQQRDDLTDYISATDATYNETYNRSPADGQVTATTRTINIVQEFQNAIMTIDFVLANIFSLESATVDPFALAKLNANNSLINIGAYTSGYLTQLRYQESLQALAERTLGDPDAWINIAIANGLKPPYIDEVGEKLLLLASADGNQINIAATDSQGKLNIDKLFINQLVLLQSDTQPFPEQRIIQNIIEVPVSGELILELDGDSDLDRYKLSESAHIRIFKPNTINSSFYILIPTDEELETEDTQLDTPWFLQSSSESEKRQRVDLGLDKDSGDLILSSSNDLSLSFGIANSAQAVLLKLGITEGELRRHSGFGLTAVQGRTNINIEEVKQQIINSITNNISSDDRFDRIEQLDVYDLRARVPSQTGDESNALYVVLSVSLAGSDTVIPISFKVNL